MLPTVLTVSKSFDLFALYFSSLITKFSNFCLGFLTVLPGESNGIRNINNPCERSNIKQTYVLSLRKPPRTAGFCSALLRAFPRLCRKTFRKDLAKWELGEPCQSTELRTDAWEPPIPSQHANCCSSQTKKDFTASESEV